MASVESHLQACADKDGEGGLGDVSCPVVYSPTPIALRMERLITFYQPPE